MKKDSSHRNIIIVSPEQIRDPGYRQPVGHINFIRKLRRLLVEEMHMVVLIEHRRECLAEIRLFRPETVRVPLVMMTATAPCKMTILTSLGCVIEYVNILREDLRRENIVLQTKILNSDFQENLESVVMEEVIHEFKRFRGCLAGMHFVSVLTRSVVKSVAGSLLRSLRHDSRETCHEICLCTNHGGMQEADGE